MGFSRHNRSRSPNKCCRYLVSAGGTPNFGDEFITAAWLRFLASEEPESDIWLDCPNPSHASILFAGMHPHLHVVNTLWQLVWNSTGSNLEERAAQTRSWINIHGTPREDFGILKLQEAASIHFLGGGYISQIWEERSLLLEAAAALKRKQPAIQLFATGLGLMPLEGAARNIVKNAAESFHVFEVRDPESAEIGGYQGHDDAFLGLCFQHELPLQPTLDGTHAFIVLQQDVVGRHPEALSVAISELRAAEVNENQEIILVEAIPPDDAWAVEPLSALWPGGVKLMPFAQLWSEGFPFTPNSVWVTSRFHMHLLGAAAGARGAVLDFGNPYYQIKHQSLFQEGTGWACAPVLGDMAGHTQVSPPNVNPRFPKIAMGLAHQKLRLAKRLYRETVPA